MKIKYILPTLILSGGLFIAGYNLGNTKDRTQDINTQTELQDKYDLVSKISVGVQISYFNKYFGEPTIINKGEDKNEYIYADPDYFVQAVTNLNNKVLSTSVTSRNKDFKPKFNISNHLNITLNETPYSQIDPQSCYRYMGAHDPVLYFEINYEGNIGNYLTYLIGTNNAGVDGYIIPEVNMEGVKLKDGEAYGEGIIDCNIILEKDRNILTPNTFVMINNKIMFKDSIPKIYFGVDNIQTRLINN